MKKSSKQLVEMAGSLEELATMICGHGSFAYHNDDIDYPIRKEAVLEYLEMGESFSLRKLAEEAISKDLEESIQKFIQNDPTERNPCIENCGDCMAFVLRAGANMKLQQLMKDAKEAQVILTRVTNQILVPTLSSVIFDETFHEGEKVKIIIIKED